MVKKKSKSQKYRKNQKRRQNKLAKTMQLNFEELKQGLENKHNNQKNNNQNNNNKNNIKNNSYYKKYNNYHKNNNDNNKKPAPKKKLVDNDKVIYNVPLKITANKNKVNQKEVKYVSLKEYIKIQYNKIEKIIKNINFKKNNKPNNNYKNYNNKNNNYNKYNHNKYNNNNKKPVVNKYNNFNKTKEKQPEIKSKNVFVRLLITIWRNRHIIFNTALILFYITLLVGLIRTKVFSANFIIYTSCIIIFLSLVAISHNKRISGKIFTVLICVAMGFGIYYLQYTYDFVRNLDTVNYEYKKYYVVTFDSPTNRSIYSLNNKKIGLTNNNSTNVTRILNTKLDKVTYIEYDNMDKMFDDFYGQHFRAVIVTENEYKYLVNNTRENTRSVKILDTFEANAHK